MRPFPGALHGEHALLSQGTRCLGPLALSDARQKDQKLNFGKTEGDHAIPTHSTKRKVNKKPPNPLGKSILAYSFTRMNVRNRPRTLRYKEKNESTLLVKSSLTHKVHMKGKVNESMSRLETLGQSMCIELQEMPKILYRTVLIYVMYYIYYI